MRLTPFLVRSVAAFAVALTLSSLKSVGAESSPPAASGMEATNSQEVMRSYLQLQEQLHVTQLAVEQNRKEARDATAQVTEALAKRLQGIEQALAAQRAKELDSLQSNSRLMLIVAGSFATLGFVAMLLMAYFQWRTVNGLAEISAAIPGARVLGAGPAIAALGPGDSVLAAGPAEQSNLRLLGAMEQLEKRLYDLEHTSRPSWKGMAESTSSSSNGNNEPASSNGGSGDAPADSGKPAADDQVSVLLGKGQSMLHLDNAEGALACFNEALALDPGNTETLVKKGTALERLQRLDEAIECYDRAIAANSSMTIAYLHKGGLYNRMERFNEALECYEQALRTQEKREA